MGKILVDSVAYAKVVKTMGMGIHGRAVIHPNSRDSRFPNERCDNISREHSP